VIPALGTFFALGSIESSKSNDFGSGSQQCQTHSQGLEGQSGSLRKFLENVSVEALIVLCNGKRHCWYGQVLSAQMNCSCANFKSGNS